MKLSGASTLGAAVYLIAAGGQILHTTIGSPTLANGAAIFGGAGTVGITDTLIANHTIGISNSLGTVYENYTFFFGNTTNKSGNISGGANDVSGDPRFQNSANDDYHLQSGSAAIDAGVNVGVPLDIDGDLRPIGYGFDIGFDETPGQRRLYLPLIVRN